ncbi:MAG: hypothetical protein KatS3mg072_1276 [Meiothermus sp.]|nr:MAG: hypothetical protein KatS3mg072_1276 [Meiothermus sp.]
MARLLFVLLFLGAALAQSRLEVRFTFRVLQREAGQETLAGFAASLWG